MAGSPPSNEEHNPAQDWELLSASALLAQGHGLGFGLPPLTTTTTPGLHTSRVEIDGISPADAGSDAKRTIIFRGKDGVSLALDASQIGMVSSTSSVEPFTEGWKPQFRIAGAPLQENYYARDPFGTPASDSCGSLEPFLNMDQDSAPEPSRAAGKEMRRSLRADKKPRHVLVDCSEKSAEHAASPHQLKNSKEDISVQGEGSDIFAAIPDALDLRKSSIKKKYFQESMRMWQKGRGLFERKPYVTWSIALTTVLLGVFFITYCSKRENTSLVHELSTSDEMGKPSQ